MDKIDILNEKIIKNRTKLIELKIEHEIQVDNKYLIVDMWHIEEQLVELEKQLQIELESI